ncbi:hypothetical protein [Hoyosella altamirensis]|uniref:Uncharacterized protein n=2 Tax=Hoyosella altamirensis TaxID=616997 RepID=A0A839RSU3_9ACTN|nr:hypothetical protein [Hoyosella altamirensis]MBB3039992.1 hypothetical protein [Hoyosella altamirensis]
MSLSESQVRRIVDELADEVVNRLLELETDGMVDPVLNPPLPNKVFIDDEWVDRVPGEQYAQDSAYAASGNAAINSAIAAGFHPGHQKTQSSTQATSRDARKACDPAGSDPSALSARQPHHRPPGLVASTDQSLPGRHLLGVNDSDGHAEASGERAGSTGAGNSPQVSPSVDVGALTVGERAAHDEVGGTTREGLPPELSDRIRRSINEACALHMRMRDHMMPLSGSGPPTQSRRDRAAWGTVAGRSVCIFVVLGVIALIVAVAS